MECTLTGIEGIEGVEGSEAVWAQGLVGKGVEGLKGGLPCYNVLLPVPRRSSP